MEVNGKEVYTAGNGPFDSQAYTDADGGVGLDTMKAYCRGTTEDIAEEHDVDFIGIEYLEIS